MILRNPGWLERVVEGAFYCGCAGVASGLTFALVRGRPVSVAPHYALNMATNFVVVGGTFLASKETAKLLRQREGVVNDVVAGGVTGSAIWGLYRGLSKTLSRKKNRAGCKIQIGSRFSRIIPHRKSEIDDFTFTH